MGRAPGTAGQGRSLSRFLRRREDRSRRSTPPKTKGPRYADENDDGSGNVLWKASMLE